jgi:hypothetical protein
VGEGSYAEDSPLLSRGGTGTRTVGSHNFLDLYWSNHNIYALLEVDVTDVRRSSRSMKRGRARHCRLLAAWPFASRVR